MATAALAVACALGAQVLTITRRLNPANLADVRAWYRRKFTIHFYATQAATVLLIAAALLAGATAATPSSPLRIDLLCAAVTQPADRPKGRPGPVGLRRCRYR